MHMTLNIISWISMTLGVILMFTAVVGAWRFPDAFTKAHALSLIDTAGALFIFISLAVHTGFNINLFKIVFIVALLWFASAINGHLTIKTAIKGGFNPTPKREGADLLTDIPHGANEIDYNKSITDQDYTNQNPTTENIRLNEGEI